MDGTERCRWLERQEVSIQRRRIGELIGQTRDLEGDLHPDGVTQLMSDNHKLKLVRRQFEQQNRRREETIASSRDNNPFLDTRIAVEMQLLKVDGP